MHKELALIGTAKILEKMFNFRNIFVFMLEPESGDYHLKMPDRKDNPDNHIIPHNLSILPWLRKNRKILHRLDLEKIFGKDELDSAYEALDKFDATLCIPIISNEDFHGILLAKDNRFPEKISDEIYELLHILCGQMSALLEYAGLRENLQKQEELAAIGIMSMEISHEIRNLLVAPQTFVELSPQRRNDDEFFNDFRKIAQDNLRILTNKIEDIKFYGRPKPPNCGYADINKIIDDILTANELKLKNVTLEKTMGDIPPLYCDSDQMVHLFNNLILNSIESMKAASGGKPRIRTGINPAPSKNLTDLAENWVRIEIKDDGVGIPEHVKKKLFTPFVTTNGTGRMGEKGTGLGLAVVKKVVDSHKGHIEVHSIESKGTTVIVNLPVKLKDLPENNPKINFL